MDWSANQYSRFLDERTRPARDLLAAVPEGRVATAVDLGCGPGNSTELLMQRYPGADVLGIDSSPDMIATARAKVPGCTFELADVTSWRPEQDCDVLFANASLQWIADRETLLPRLLGFLSKGGSLAVQMPDNLGEPVHQALRDISDEPRWRDRLRSAREGRQDLAPPSELYALLKPFCSRVDIWRTVYQHVMDGPEGVVDWFKGSALRPFLAKLNDEESKVFLGAFRDEVARSYPAGPENVVLLPFPRYFFVATKG